MDNCQGKCLNVDSGTSADQKGVPTDDRRENRAILDPETTSFLGVYGARTHNLKNIDVKIPCNKITAITGPSGCGKSSLAFNTIFAEGQRQYIESLSTYSRQYLRNLERPDVDSVSGLQPTIMLEQRQSEPNSRSTVATVSEIYDFLRVLFANVGVAHCFKCGRPIQRYSIEQIKRVVCQLPENTRFILLAPVVLNERGEHRNVFHRLLKSGFTRARVDGVLLEINTPPVLEPKKSHTIEAVVDRLILREEIEKRLEDSIKLALTQSDGLVCCQYEKERQKTEQGTTRSVWKDLLFSVRHSCPKCNVAYAEVEPRIFNYNSPYGACPKCGGEGKIAAFDPNLLVPNPEASLADGSLTLGKGLSIAIQRKLNEALQIFARLSPSVFDVPICEWNEKERRRFFYGFDEHEKISCEKKINVLDSGGNQDSVASSLLREGDGSISDKDLDILSKFVDITSSETKDKTCSEKSTVSKDEDPNDSHDQDCFIGIVPLLEKIFLNFANNSRERIYLEKFRGKVICNECGGARLRREGRFVTINGKNIFEVIKMTVAEASEWFKELTFDETQKEITAPLLNAIQKRLETMERLRLEYLTLDRPTDTLSGGELQRIRLATVLGSDLSGVCFLLDEPSAGLHPRDSERLLDVVHSLKESGNTVILVEHDETLVRNADWLIDMGPGAGSLGGEVLASGTPESVAKCSSPTGDYLSGRSVIPVPEKRRKIVKTRSLALEGVNTNNLKNVSTFFPLELLTCVTGVSGSGKSSLVMDTLVPALRRRLRNVSIMQETDDYLDSNCNFKSLRGASKIDKLVVVDQSPLGRNQRSNPATYSGIFDEIRKHFANSLEAKVRGFKAGRFSFNVAGGRCEDCQGLGVQKIESSFIPDMYVACPSCEGKRFNRATLDVRYHGKTIADALDMTFDEAYDFWNNVPTLVRMIECFKKVGLGYLTLGQSASSLSGGEAQRVKLATELARGETGKTLFVLDEPTVGLHPHDVSLLLQTLNDIVQEGNTVVVIEHSLDVMKCADWIVDVGPEGGAKGGYILASGTPEEVADVEGNETARFLRKVLPTHNH